MKRLSLTSKRFLFLFEQALYRHFELETGTSIDRNIVPLSLSHQSFRLMWPKLKSHFPNHFYQACEKATNICFNVIFVSVCCLVSGLALLHIYNMTMLDGEERRVATASLYERIGYIVINVLPKIFVGGISMGFFLEGEGPSTVKRISRKMMMHWVYFRYMELFRRRALTDSKSL